MYNLNLPEHGDIRYAVAQNPQTPPETLAMLAEDSDNDVRCAVAANQNTPAETLALLAEDKVWLIRCRVARHRNTPTEILALLKKDTDMYVQEVAKVTIKRQKQASSENGIRHKSNIER